MNFFTKCVVVLSLIIPIVSIASFSDAQNLTPAKIIKGWSTSPHADTSSEAFIHWNKDGEIPGSCAVCHSTKGATDYMAGPMSTPGIIDHPVPVGGGVECAACHNPDAEALKIVPFPSGASLDKFGRSATCAVCHQGRASKKSVDQAIIRFDEDAIQRDLSFINIHYAASAASLMGTLAQSGYEYENREYKGQFNHVPNLSVCADCHNPHTLEVAQTSCAACHQDIVSFKDIRTSPTDFDGDGDTKEGIADPISSMKEQLGAAIHKYAAEIANAPIVYSPTSYPYFFNGSADSEFITAEKETFPNRYQSWTPRLLKAAYNYQYVTKDKGIYAHNPHYALQLLYDSLENLSEVVEIDISSFTRPRAL
jgi:cytochrome c553